MDMLSLTYTIGCVIIGGLLIWFKTSAGKEWLKNL